MILSVFCFFQSLLVCSFESTFFLGEREEQKETASIELKVWLKQVIEDSM